MTPKTAGQDESNLAKNPAIELLKALGYSHAPQDEARAGGEKRRKQCSGRIASFGPRVTRHATRPLRFIGRQTFLRERTRPPPMVFTIHETRNTSHGIYAFH